MIIDFKERSMFCDEFYHRKFRKMINPHCDDVHRNPAWENHENPHQALENRKDDVELNVQGIQTEHLN